MEVRYGGRCMRVLVDMASDGGPVGIPIIVGVSCGCVI